MANTGPATKTAPASAAVVESDAVGGTYPGKTTSRFDTRMNRNSVPTKAR